MVSLGPMWMWSLQGVLSFVASGLDVNGCVLYYFEGTANLHCDKSCTLTTSRCLAKWHALTYVSSKATIKHLQKSEKVYSLL